MGPAGKRGESDIVVVYIFGHALQLLTTQLCSLVRIKSLLLTILHAMIVVIRYPTTSGHDDLLGLKQELNVKADGYPFHIVGCLVFTY
jgi:hypothetical protein